MVDERPRQPARTNHKSHYLHKIFFLFYDWPPRELHLDASTYRRVTKNIFACGRVIENKKVVRRVQWPEHKRQIYENIICEMCFGGVEICKHIKCANTRGKNVICNLCFSVCSNYWGWGKMQNNQYCQSGQVLFNGL